MLRRRLPDAPADPDMKEYASMTVNGDVAKFAIRANSAAVATCIAFMVAATQVALPADCQGNYNAAQLIELCRESIKIFLLGLLSSSYHYISQFFVSIAAPIASLFYMAYRIFKILLRRNVPFYKFEEPFRKLAKKHKDLLQRKKPLTRQAIALDYFSAYVLKFRLAHLSFLFGVMGISIFFFGIHAISPAVFKILSWPEMIQYQRDAAIECSSIGKEPANATPINPYKK